MTRRRRRLIPAGRLTRRQLQVLRLRATGRTYLEVADVLGIAESTVRNHLFDAHRRLDVQSTIGAFVKLGWLVPPE